MESKLSLQVASFKLSERELEIIGPVEFVEKQLETHVELVNTFMNRIKNKSSPNTESMVNERNSEVLGLTNTTSDYTDFEEIPKSNNFLRRYNTIIAIDNEKIQLLTHVPGESLIKRMINLAILYLWIRRQQNVESASFNEIRDFCERHAELDRSHFSHYLNNNKKIFLVDGSVRSQFAKLTVPGLREAEILLEQMNNQEH